MLLQAISSLKNCWKHLFVLPLLTIVFFAGQPENLKAQIKNVPAIEEEQIDTIIMFDSFTNEETIQVVKKNRSESTATHSISQQIIGDDYVTDTIVTFDPDTYTETVTVVKIPFYKEVDQMPTFGDCPNLHGEELTNCSQNALLSYIYSNVLYPKEATANRIEGTVLTKFVIREDGYIENIKIERSVSPAIDAEVQRVLAKMQDYRKKALWKPGKKDGEIVNVQFVLPVKFKLE